MSFSPEYRPTTPRDHLNLAERATNHLFASTLYGLVIVTHPGILFKVHLKDIPNGYQEFYRNLNLEGQLPFRPSI